MKRDEGGVRWRRGLVGAPPVDRWMWIALAWVVGLAGPVALGALAGIEDPNIFRPWVDDRLVTAINVGLLVFIIPGSVIAVVYHLLLASGRLPLLHLRADSGVVSLATSLGRLGAPRRRIVCAGRVAIETATVVPGAVIETLTVICGKDRLTVRTKGQLPETNVRAFIERLEEAGLDVRNPGVGLSD